MDDKQKRVVGILRELKEDFPDFDLNKYKADISERIFSEQEIEDITEEELLLLGDLDEEDLEDE